MTNTISKDDIRQLCQVGEHAEVEFKSAKGGFPKSFWETFSAFANTNGGMIVLGIKQKEDTFLPDYLTKAELTALKKIFWDTAHNRSKVSQSLLEEQDITTVEVAADSYALIFRVPRAEYSKRPVYLTENPMGHTYKRKHEGDYVCSDEEVRQMFADANHNASPEDGRILAGYTIDDLDAPSIRQYREEFKHRHDAHPWIAKTDIDFLKSVGAIVENRAEGINYVTVAGMLMFGKSMHITNPACLPYFFVDYREKMSLDPDVRWTNRIYPDGMWEANLYQFYSRVLPILQSSLPLPFQLDKQSRRVDKTAAHEAVREALTNALVHCAYNMNGSIVVERTRKGIYMCNPGTMLVSIEDFYEGGHSECRNPSLQKMFMFLGGGEKAGSGADKIVTGWQKNKWLRPELSEHVSPDRVELMMPIEDLYKLTEQIDRINDRIKISELTENQRKIYFSIVQADRINDRANDRVNDRANIVYMVKVTNLSYSTIQRALRTLEKGLLVKQVGADKNKYWTTKME